MGIKLNNIFYFGGILTVMVTFLSSGLSAELIEINRVTAKVNDRIVTWGEIERAMDRLNFTDEEKKQRATEFVDGKIDRLLSIFAFEEKGMGIPESMIEQEYNKRLIQEFNGIENFLGKFYAARDNLNLSTEMNLEKISFTVTCFPLAKE